MTAPMQHVPDSALVERIMAGDEGALAALYDRYAGMLFAMLVRILRDTSAAEEVLQDLFLQLWRGASRFDASRGSLAAWLLVIGRNRALSRLRGKGRHEILADSEEFSIEAVPSSGNLEDEVARMQLMERLRGAMAALPQEQREACLLYTSCTAPTARLATGPRDRTGRRWIWGILSTRRWWTMRPCGNGFREGCRGQRCQRLRSRRVGC